MPLDKKIEKKEIKIPVRLISQDPVFYTAKKKRADKPEKKPAIKKVVRAEKTQPPAQDIFKQKRKLYALVCIFGVAIFIGWIFYFKGTFSHATWDSAKLKAAREELTNVFQSFGRVFSNIQKLNKNAISNQSAEEFEKRVFPQFIKSQ